MTKTIYYVAMLLADHETAVGHLDFHNDDAEDAAAFLVAKAEKRGKQVRKVMLWQVATKEMQHELVDLLERAQTFGVAADDADETAIVQEALSEKET